MAFIGAKSRLLDKKANQKFLGVCQEYGSERVLLSFDSELVIVQPHEARVLHSWTSSRKRNHKFSGAAVFSPEDQEYVMVQDAKVLRICKKSDLDQTETFTLKYKIRSLVPCGNSNLVVLLDDGSVFHLQHVLEDPNEIVPDPPLKIGGNTILFASGFTQEDGKLTVVSICQAKKGYKLVASSLHVEENDAKHYESVLECNGYQLKALTAFQDQTASLISTIWGDGSLRRLTYQVIDSGGIDFQLEKVVTLEIDSHVSVAAMSPDQVAVLCRGGTIAIVDLKFGSMLQKIDVDTGINKIFALGDYLFLDAPAQIQTLQFSANPVTLASALLRLTGSEPNKVHCAQWSDPPTQMPMLTGDDESLVEILFKTSQQTNFDKTWAMLWKGKSEKFQKEFYRSQTMRIMLARFGSDDKRKKFWPQSTVSKMVSTGLACGRWCDGVFSQVLERNNWEMLLECVQKINDIPEPTINQCLAHLARYRDDGNSKNAMDCDELLPQMQACINEIIQLPYSDNAMRKEISTMPFSSVLNFTSYLTRLLGKMSIYSQSPNLDQVICWLNLVIDAHISEIIMLEDSWPVMQQLQDAVELQTATLNECTEICRMLTRIKCKLRNVTKSSRKSLYFVEIMRF